jgi:multicomponent Na+:H+ antiporter subunit D
MKSSIVIILPIIFPLIIAVLCIAFWFKQKVQKFLNIIGALGFLATGILLFFTVKEEKILITQLGNWPAPYGITLVADMFSAIMIFITTILASGAAFYSNVSMDPKRRRYGYFPLFYFLMAGVCGAFLTGDIFNLYVFFEVILISSFVMIALGSDRAQLEGAMKYVTLNLFASVIFLTAVGMTYGVTGSLNFADLAVKVAAYPDKGLLNLLAILYIIAFGIKAAVFPLFFWLPASYHTPPVAVSALFAGLLTKIGVYAFIRIFSLIFTHDVDFTHFILLVISGFTMVAGVLGAAAQTELRRLLSFHIISQIGYMIMGLAIFTPLSIAGAIFFTIHNIIVKNMLFLVSGIIYKIRGHYQLKFLGGLYKSQPLISVLFLIPALSLAGIPPLSGFWGKFLLMRSGINAGEYFVIGVSMVVSVITLFSMTKIWKEAFWKEDPDLVINTTNTFEKYSTLQKGMLIGPIIWLCFIMLTMSFWVEWYIEAVNTAAEQLMDKNFYIDHVLKR